MVDQVDLANDLIDNEVSLALRKLRQHSAGENTEGAKSCFECGEDIPEARRNLGFKLCVSCAEESERRRSLFAE